MDQGKETLYEKLQQYGKSDAYPFHMPGHKRNIECLPSWNPYEMDITEIYGFDNLHDSHEILEDTRKEIAAFRGAEESFLLVNGTTGGLLSAISACVSHGDSILIARNCHKAVYNAIYLNELCTHYIYPHISHKMGINGGIPSEEVEKMLITFPNIRLVVLTSPTYEGVVSDIKEIAEIVHRHGIPLLVDQAHGAHFGMGVHAPVPAQMLGADLVVESVHKTLPAFTQTALLHVQGNLVDRKRLQKFLGIYQTSSPSYPLMAGIAWCMDFCKKEKTGAFVQYEKRIAELRGKIDQLEYIELFDGRREACEFGAVDYDTGKLVFGVKDQLLSGEALCEILREQYHLEMEMASLSYVIAMTSVLDTEEGLQRLYEALREINENVKKTKKRKIDSKTGIKNIKLCNPIVHSVYKMEKTEGEMIKFSETGERIAKEYIYLYPPGIPLIVPGEKITEEFISYVETCRKQGLTVIGLEEDKFLVARKEIS